MPRTIIDLEQSDYQASSGSFASDEEVYFAPRTLPQKGDYNTGTAGNTSSIPWLALANGQAQFVTWNILCPQAASGIAIEWFWTPAATRTGTVRFDLRAQEIIENDYLAAGLYAESYYTWSGTWTTGFVYKHSIILPLAPTMLPVYELNLRLSRLGNADTMATPARILGVNLSFF
jgi:hypothetical protein